MKIEEIEIHQQRKIFYNVLNDNGFLFGGEALKWMDEVAYLTASQLTSQKLVTVSVDKVKFICQIPPGSEVDIRGKYLKHSFVKLFIAIDILVRNKMDNSWETAIEGIFILAPINDDNKPEILKLQE